MTTETERVVDEAAAHEALTTLEKIERAIDGAYEHIAGSLDLADRKAVEGRVKALRDDIKQYLEEQGGSLHDGEFDVTAALQPRSGTATYDLVTCVESGAAHERAVTQGEEAVLAAARAGILRVDHTMLDRFRDKAGGSWADTIHRFRMPGKGSVALLIKRGG